MSSQELRFSLAERKPGGIKSQGGASGEKVSLQDANRVQDILKEIHSTSAEDHKKHTDWILLSYVDKEFKTLKLFASGSGGLDQLRQQSFPNDQVLYGLLRVIDDNVGVNTTRFVYLTWIGEKMSAISNARIGVKKTAVSEIIGHYSIEVLISNVNELTIDNVVGRVRDASGSSSHVKEKPSEGGISPVLSRGAVNKPLPSFVPVNSASNQPILSVDNELVLKDFLKAIRCSGDDSMVSNVSPSNSNLNWLSIGYTNPNRLCEQGHGSGGLNELCQQLNSDRVSYAFLSVQYKFDATIMKRFVYIRWVPEGVPAIIKGKLTVHRGFIENWFSPYHLTINAAYPDELTNDVIVEKLGHMSGKK